MFLYPVQETFASSKVTKTFSHVLFIYIFFGLAFTFRSTTHVKFIFLYGLNKRCEFPLAAITKFQKHLSG